MTAHILVVEDDAANRSLLERLLGRDGYRTSSVADGREALSAIDELEPDLVLLDIGLPFVDGLEITRRLRSNPETDALPIILLTGRTGPDSVVEGLDAGADDFVSKPFHAAELLARLRSTFRLRQALARMDAAHSAVAALANAVEAKDPMTERHCQRLANLAARIGVRAGLDTADLESLAMARSSMTSGRSASPRPS